MTTTNEPDYRYLTLWYPTIFHKPLEPLNLNGKKVEAEISDTEYLDVVESAKIPKHTIHLELTDEQDINVNFIITEPSKEILTFKLERVDIRQNGFAQYKYDLSLILNSPIYSKIYNKAKEIKAVETAEEEIKGLAEKLFEKSLVKDVYHLAKDFYHIHEAKTDKDSALRARINYEKEELKGDDNKFLIGFLSDFVPVFEEYAYSISAMNAKIVEAESKLATVDNTKLDKLKEKIITYSFNVAEMCENALIEYTYYKALYHSKYNKSFLCTIDIPDNCINEEQEGEKQKKERLRRMAFNAHNAMRYVKNIKYKNQNRTKRISIQTLEQLQANTIAVRANTEEVGKMLREGETSNKMSFASSLFGIFISITFGFLFFIERKNIGAIEKWYWILILGIVIYTAYILYQYFYKKKKT